MLKGYCLTNEHCPVGCSVPLLRSRDGTWICCCDDPKCPYNEEAQTAPKAEKKEEPKVEGAGASGAEPAAEASPTSAQAVASSQDIQSNFSPEPRRTLQEAVAVAPAAADGGVAAAGNSTASQRPSLAASASAASNGCFGGATFQFQDLLLTLQGPSYQFGCSCLVTGAGRPAHLKACAYSLKVRLGYSSCDLDQEGLSRFLGESCQQFRDKILLPNASLFQTSRAAGQVLVACGDSTRFEFPDSHCLELSKTAGRGSASELAAHFAERIAEYLVSHKTRVKWIETSIIDGFGAEVCCKGVF